MNIFNQSTSEVEEPDVIDTIDVALPSKVILFNDEWHTFDEVVNQVIKAIKCNYDTAERITMEAHTKGKAVVYSGDMSECLKVSGILEEIALHTQIEY